MSSSPLEREHRSVHRQTPGLHFCGRHAESHHRGGHHNHDGEGRYIFKHLHMKPSSFGESNEAFSLFCLIFFLFFHDYEWVSCQTVTEKHKLNVPETMTEILDVSDEEGELF